MFQQNNNDDLSTESEEIVIGQILNHRKNKNELYFQVQITENGRRSKRWVSENDLQNCDELLETYWQKNKSSKVDTNDMVVEKKKTNSKSSNSTSSNSTKSVKSTKSTKSIKSNNIIIENIDDNDEKVNEMAVDVTTCDPFSSQTIKNKTSLISKYLDDEDDSEPIKKKLKLNDDDVVDEIENILGCVHEDGVNDYHIKWVGKKSPSWIYEDEFIDCDLLNEFNSYEKNRANANLPRRAYIYCRTSRRNADKEVSLYDQEKRCLEFAKRNNINIIGVYKDNGVSAKDMKNQFALNFVCSRIKKGECILFYDVSRFSRSLVQAIQRLEHLRKNVGAIAHSCHDGLTWNNIATNRNGFIQNLSNSQLHSEVISEKVLSSIEYRKERGDHIGYVPYGYRTEIVDGSRKLIDNEDEQTVIKMIIDEGMNIVADRFGGMNIRNNGKITKGAKNTKGKKVSKVPTNQADRKRLQSKMSEFTPKEYHTITATVNEKYSNRNGKPFTWQSVRKIIKARLEQ